MRAMTRRGNAEPGTLAQCVRGLGLFALVALVALRPLVSESHDSAGSSITQAIDALADPWPARTLLFDLLILLSACTWAISLVLDKKATFRRTGLEAGLVLLAVAGVVSCAAAGNKRLAINGAVDWLCYPLLTITLVQLIRSAAHRRIVLAAILATAAVQAAQCFEQYFLGFAETLQEYESGREEFWASQGIDLDSTTVEAFERRLRAREASGFFAHSNVAGSYLVLCAFAGLSIIAARPNRHSTPSAPTDPAATIAKVAAAAIVIAMFGAAALTGSKAALFAGALATILCAFAVWRREWIAHHRKKVFAVAWAAVAFAVIAVVGHGLYHDSLPGWSLTFRWQYWKASAAMIADHLWTGVGRENFGRVYTAYKDIASPEEVANPHNLFVQTAAEWGVIGLAGLAAMLLGVTWVAARSGHTNSAAQTDSDRNSAAANVRGSVGWLLAIGACVIGARLLFLGSADANFAYYSAVTTALVWFPAFAAFAYCAPPFDERGTARLLLGAGLIALLTQDMVGFSLFVPGSATVFFAALAVWISAQSPPAAPQDVHQTRSARMLVPATALVATALFVWFVLWPVGRSNRLLAEARGHAFVTQDANANSIAALFAASAAADPIDPTPWLELARWRMTHASHESAHEAIAALDQAILRDPHNHSLLRRKTQIALAVAAASGKPDDFLAAIAAARTALAKYPQNPAGLALLADAQLAAGRSAQSPDLLREALHNYEEALALDGRRLSWETIQRLRPRELEEISRKIELARNSMDKLRS